MKEYNFYPFYKSIFGLDNYDFLISCLDPLHLNWINYIDYRPFTMFRDHKKTMNIRIDFLSTNYALVRESKLLPRLQKAYLDLYKISKKNVSFVIKYNTTKNIDIIKLLIENLSMSKNLEAHAIKDFINIIGELQ